MCLTSQKFISCFSILGKYWLRANQTLISDNLTSEFHNICCRQQSVVKKVSLISCSTFLLRVRVSNLDFANIWHLAISFETINWLVTEHSTEHRVVFHLCLRHYSPERWREADQSPSHPPDGIPRARQSPWRRWGRPSPSPWWWWSGD